MAITAKPIKAYYDHPFYLMLIGNGSFGYTVLGTGEEEDMKKEYAKHLKIAPFAIMQIWDTAEFKTWIGFEELFGEGVYG